MTSLLNFASADTAILVTLVTLSVSMAKIIEVLVRKISPSRKKTLSEDEFEKIKGIDYKLRNIHTQINDKPTLSDDQNTMLQDLHNWHNKTDADGIPLWYVPRSFIESQKEIVEVLSEISSHQERTTFLLEALLKRIEKLEDRVETGLRNKKNEE
jgi:hypothetical protein